MRTRRGAAHSAPPRSARASLETPFASRLLQPHPAEGLHGRAAAFLLLSPHLGGARGRPLLPRRRGFGGPSDQVQKPLAGVRAVPELAAEAPRADDDDAIGRHAAASEPGEPLAYRVRQRGGVTRVEPQLHRRRHLVDMLPARPRGRHEHLLELGRIDGDGGGDSEHGLCGHREVSCYQAPTINTGSGKAAMTSSARHTIDDLLAVMAALRTPGSGCPWDLQQTFKTIVPYTIEEAYEVEDAIDQGDRTALRDELGDLLLQVVYYVSLAEEEVAFDAAAVAKAITAKMIRRHPHVFGSEAERMAGARPGFWERIKAQEREAKAVPSPCTGGEPPCSILQDVPVALPALTRALKLQHKAARVGFDWPSLAPVFDKLKEELVELEQAAGGAGTAPRDRVDRSKVEEELGDLLFVVANVARHLGIDPEGALRGANQKFMRRFGRIEALLAAEGRTPAQSTLAEMDRLWDQAKAEEPRV